MLSRMTQTDAVGHDDDNEAEPTEDEVAYAKYLDRFIDDPRYDNGFWEE